MNFDKGIQNNPKMAQLGFQHVFSYVKGIQNIYVQKGCFNSIYAVQFTNEGDSIGSLLLHVAPQRSAG